MNKLLFLGDLYYDYNQITDDIEKLSKWIQANEYVTIVNLEGSIRSNADNPIKKRGPNLANSSAVVDVLKKLNVIGVCLANNHTLDFGSESLAETLHKLDENGIKHTGAGLDIHQALRPMTFEIEDKTYAVINFGWDVEETVYASETLPGCAPREKAVILDTIRQVSKTADRVIVCLHWGFEYNRLPMPRDIALAHNIIDAGAELIIGHHPHCVQPKETYSNKSIYYSLGNFYFSSRRDKFKKEFKESIISQSDFGAMVSYDPITQKDKHFIIQYNRLSKTSELNSEVSDLVL